MENFTVSLYRGITLRNYHPSMPAPANILFLHGPNLNLLGEREPERYGSTTLDAINKKLAKRAAAAGVVLTVYQTNIEGDLVSRIQRHATNRSTSSSSIRRP